MKKLNRYTTYLAFMGIGFLSLSMQSHTEESLGSEDEYHFEWGFGSSKSFTSSTPAPSLNLELPSESTFDFGNTKYQPPINSLKALSYPEIEATSATDYTSTEFTPETLREVSSMVLQGRLDEAIHRLSRLSQHHLREDLYFWLGTAHLLKNEYKEAAKALDKAIEIDSTLSHLWIQRAIVEQEKGQPAVALQYLRLAKDLEEDLSPNLVLNTAYAHESLGNYAAARAAYIKYIHLTSEQQESQRLISSVMRRMSALPQTSAIR